MKHTIKFGHEDGDPNLFVPKTEINDTKSEINGPTGGAFSGRTPRKS